jgi:hypothetical protein
MRLSPRSFKKLDWLAFVLWVLVTSLSSIVGLVVAFVVALLLANGLGDWMASAILGLTFGLVLGSAQTWVIGRWVAQPMAWIVATAVGGVFDFGGVALAIRWNSPETTCMTALVLALAQWLVLRRWVTHAAWWVLATVTGRVCGVTLLLAMGDATEFPLNLLALQIPLAIITAATLVTLFRNTDKLFPANLSPRPLGL